MLEELESSSFPANRELSTGSNDLIVDSTLFINNPIISIVHQTKLC